MKSKKKGCFPLNKIVIGGYDLVLNRHATVFLFSALTPVCLWVYPIVFCVERFQNAS